MAEIEHIENARQRVVAELNALLKHDSLAAALAAFQAELPKLRKDETAKVRGEGKDGQPVNYQYGYADLAQVTEAVSPVLGKHGLSFTCTPTMAGNQFVLEYCLLHESGEKREGVWPLPNPMQTKPQNLGSAITYARRYALMAVTNTFPDKEDDDGQKAADVPGDYSVREERSEPPARRQPAAQQRQSRQRQPKTEWSDGEVQELHLKIAAATPPDALKMYDWMVSKALHDREVPHPTIPGETASARFVFADRIAQEAVKPTSTRDSLIEMRHVAEARELLREQVSETETLDEALAGVLALRNAEALDTDHARELRAEADASWMGAHPEEGS